MSIHQQPVIGYSHIYVVLLIILKPLLHTVATFLPEVKNVRHVVL